MYLAPFNFTSEPVNGSNTLLRPEHVHDSTGMKEKLVSKSFNTCIDWRQLFIRSGLPKYQGLY